MENCFSAKSEPDVTSEKVKNVPDSLPLEKDNERLKNTDSHRMN